MWSYLSWMTFTNGSNHYYAMGEQGHWNRDNLTIHHHHQLNNCWSFSVLAEHSSDDYQLACIFLFHCVYFYSIHLQTTFVFLIPSRRYDRSNQSWRETNLCGAYKIEVEKSYREYEKEDKVCRRIADNTPTCAIQNIGCSDVQSFKSLLLI